MLFLGCVNISDSASLLEIYGTTSRSPLHTNRIYDNLPVSIELIAVHHGELSRLTPGLSLSHSTTTRQSRRKNGAS